jgi:hypothetical protein
LRRVAAVVAAGLRKRLSLLASLEQPSLLVLVESVSVQTMVALAALARSARW